MIDRGPTSGAPDWNTLGVALHCPRCGYDLRMLPQPRCPECGLQFEWAELITAVRTQNECPLFEYQWRRRPVRSFLRTVGRALLPWRLWSRMSLAWEPQVRPLFVLAAFMVLLFAVCSLGVEYARDACAAWQFTLLTGRAYPGPVWRPDLVAHVGEVTGHLLWALFVWGLLQIYQQTIAKYQLRQRQLLRVIVLAWVGLLAWQTVSRLTTTAFALYLALLHASRGTWYPLTWTREQVWTTLLPYVVFTLSLCLGLSTYLRIRRGWAMSLATMIIIVLALIAPVPAITVATGSPSNTWTRVLTSLWPGIEYVMEKVFVAW